MMAQALSLARRGLLAAALACAAALPSLVAAQAGAPRAPGAGFADPQGLPPRPAPADIEPVYRGPSVDTLATVRKRGTLRVGVVPVEPMVMRDKRGEWVGFSIDLARKLAADIGVGVEFVPSSWDYVIPDLLSRQFDLIVTGLWVTVPRALVVNFTQPTAEEGVYLVAHQRGAATLKQRADFDRIGVTLAVNAGSVHEALARRLFPRATVLPVDDDPLAAVLQGKAQAMVLSSLSPQGLLRAAPGQLYLPLDQPLAATPAAMAVRKGDPDFLSFLNTWLQLQRDDGLLAERAAYWSSSSDWLK